MVYTLYMDSLQQLVCVYISYCCLNMPSLPSAGSRMCYQGNKGSVWSYMYISHLFLVLVLWNKLLSWIRAQQLVGDLLSRDLFESMNSVQPTTSNGYIVSTLAIAIVVAMSLETVAAVQASLLLRCGDIETNPGPLTREGM